MDQGHYQDGVPVITRADAAAALRHIADLLREGRDEGKIYDVNGNHVGDWSFDA